MSVGYKSPDRSLREQSVAGAGGAATTEYGKFRSFFASKLNRVKAWVTVAGTAVGHGFDVYVGTTSVGTLALGTGAANSEVTATLNVDVPAGSPVSVKSLADTVGKADVVFEFKRTE